MSCHFHLVGHLNTPSHAVLPGRCTQVYNGQRTTSHYKSTHSSCFVNKLFYFGENILHEIYPLTNCEVGREEINFLFTDDVIVYVENLKEFIKKTTK